MEKTEEPPPPRSEVTSDLLIKFCECKFGSPAIDGSFMAEEHVKVLQTITTN